MSRFRLSGEAVFERILQQGLEDKGRNKSVTHFRCDRPVDCYAIARPEAHDVEVPLRKIQFRFQRNFLTVALLHDCPQQLGEIHDCLIGPLWIAMQDSRYGVESVEEKVWVKLRSQRFELHLGNASLELKLNALSLLELTVILKAVHDGDHRPEDHQLDDDVSGKNAGEGRRLIPGEPLLHGKENRVFADADE